MPKKTSKSSAGAAARGKKTAEKATKKTTKSTKSTKSTKRTKTAKTAKTAKKKTVKKAAQKTTNKAGKSLRVRQVRSGIRHPWRMRRTLTALGLKHHQDEVVVPDNPSVRGMLRRVHHLVSVTPEDTNG